MDICGELEFMETMKVKYHEKAVETGSLVVSTVLGVPNVEKLRRGCQDLKEQGLWQDILQKKKVSCSFISSYFSWDCFIP